MCNKIDCPLYGGACGLAKLGDANKPFVSCYECKTTVDKNAPDGSKGGMQAYVLTSVKTSADGTEVKTRLLTDMSTATEEMFHQYAESLGKLGLKFVSPEEYFTDEGAGTGVLSFTANGVQYKWTIERQTVGEPNTRCVAIPDEIRVNTPAGTLIACNQKNPLFPGIAIDLEFEQNGQVEKIGLGNIEWGENDNGERGIFIALFRNTARNDCTEYLPFKDEANLFGVIPAELVTVSQNGNIKKKPCTVNILTGQAFDVEIEDDDIGTFIEVQHSRYILYDKKQADANQLHFWYK